MSTYIVNILQKYICVFIILMCVHYHRPDMLVRAARHYEGAGQVLLRQAVMSAQEFVSIGQGEMPPIGEWQEVECPARLDLSGESALFEFIFRK